MYLSLLSVRQDAEDFSPFSRVVFELNVVSTQGDKSDYSSVVPFSRISLNKQQQNIGRRANWRRFLIGLLASQTDDRQIHPIVT